MKREMRSRRVYEYPRGGLYRESNAEQQAQPAPYAAPTGPATNNGAGRGRGRGRGRSTNRPFPNFHEQANEANENSPLPRQD